MKYDQPMDPADRKILDRLLEDIAGLRVHHDSEGRPSLKKPLLLLLVLSRIESDKLTENRIRFGDIEKELAELIARHGTRGGKTSTNPEEPFFYLATSPFWTLHYPDSIEDSPKVRRSKRALRDPATYAALADDVFALLLRSKPARTELTTRLVERWWPAEAGSALRTDLDL